MRSLNLRECNGQLLDNIKLMNEMIEALDTELGRVLVQTGIASYDGKG